MSDYSEESKNGMCCVFGCAGPLFLLAALGMTWMMIGQPLQQAKTAQQWVVTPCVITSSQVRTTRGKTWTYSIDIHYNYTWNGQALSGKRYSFAPGSNVGVAEMQKIVNSLPPGTKTVCYVNPAQPLESVLDPHTKSGLWIGLVPLCILFIAGGLFYGIWRQKMRAASDPTL